MQDLTGLQQ